MACHCCVWKKEIISPCVVPRCCRRLSGWRFPWTGVHEDWQCLETPALIGLTAFNLPLAALTHSELFRYFKQHLSWFWRGRGESGEEFGEVRVLMKMFQFVDPLISCAVSSALCPRWEAALHPGDLAVNPQSPVVVCSQFPLELPSLVFPNTFSMHFVLFQPKWCCAVAGMFEALPPSPS